MASTLRSSITAPMIPSIADVLYHAGPMSTGWSARRAGKEGVDQTLSVRMKCGDLQTFRLADGPKPPSQGLLGRKGPRLSCLQEGDKGSGHVRHPKAFPRRPHKGPRIVESPLVDLLSSGQGAGVRE